MVDQYRWRTGVPPLRAVDPATRGRLQDSVRALGEEADANQAALERRAIAHDDPGCPPDIFGPDKPDTSERHHRTDRDHSRQERDDRDER